MKSPHSKTLFPKSLTGNIRCMRDLAADVHSNIQQWNNTCLLGTNIIKTIIQEKNNEQYSVTLQELCDRLEAACDALDIVGQNLIAIAGQITTLTCLFKAEDRPFGTWPVQKFVEVANFIAKCYDKEANAKRTILENIAHNCFESHKMLHLAAWAHQPAIPSNCMILLESLLTETEHR